MTKSGVIKFQFIDSLMLDEEEPLCLCHKILKDNVHLKHRKCLN